MRLMYLTLALVALCSTSYAQRIFRASEPEAAPQEHLVRTTPNVPEVKEEKPAPKIYQVGDTKVINGRTYTMTGITDVGYQRMYRWEAKNSQPTSNRYTQQELDQWVRARYNPRSRLAADVEPRNAVWSHLQDPNHGFSASQVKGLDFWVAMALHSASHEGQISPIRSTSQPLQAASESLGCANGQCPTAPVVRRGLFRW